MTQPLNTDETSVITVLLEQHTRIRRLFSQVKDAKNEEKQQRFDELRRLLAVHETGEELVLRPVSKDTAGSEVTDARNKEESEAAHVLAELEKMDIDTLAFDAKFSEFELAVSRHAEAEEQLEFPTVTSQHTVEELDRMGRRLLAAEKAAPTHPHPATAGSPLAQAAVGPFASLLDRARDAFNQR
jgi:hemerythrin superfamily protein